MVDANKVKRALDALVDVGVAIDRTVKLINDTATLVAEAREVAASDDRAKIDAALERIQARNDVEVPEAIAALRAQ